MSHIVDFGWVVLYWGFVICSAIFVLAMLTCACGMIVLRVAGFC